MYEFQLLRGVHSQDGQTYYPGEIFTSEHDLAARFNLPKCPARVTLLREFDPLPGETQPPKPTEGDLDAMTAAELREMAAAEGITVEGLTKKADLAERIKAALA
jgi:hypothetical protein